MKLIYGVAGWGIALLGAMHMLATVRIPSDRGAYAVWFFGSGLAISLVGALNLLNRAYGSSAAGLRWVCVAGNVVMSAVAGVAGIVTGASATELAIVLGLMGGATALSPLRHASRPSALQ